MTPPRRANPCKRWSALSGQKHDNPVYLVCVRMRSNLSLPPAPHRATISYLAMSTSLSTAASDQLYFVWDSSRGKSSGSAQTIISRRAVTIILFVLALVTINFPSAIKKSTPEMRPCLHLANEFLFYILLNDLLEQSKNWSIHDSWSRPLLSAGSSIISCPTSTTYSSS